MFESLRKKQKSISAVLLIGFSVVLMISFGLDYQNSSQNSASSSAAIKVAGMEVSSGEFQNQLEQNLDIYRRFRTNVDESLRDRIRQDTIDGVITDRLLKKFATDLGLSASPQMIEAKLLESPFFQGQAITKASWNDFLSTIGMSAAAVEEMTRNDVIREQVIDTLAQLNIPTDDIAKSVFESENRLMRFKYLEIPVSNFERDVVVEDAALQEFYNKRGETYKQPKRAQFNLVTFPHNDYLSRVDVTDEDLQQTYEMQRSKFVDPKQYKLTILTLPLPKKGDDLLNKLVANKDKKEKTSEESSLNNAETIKALAKSLTEKLNLGEEFTKVSAEATGQKQLNATVLNQELMTEDQIDSSLKSALAKLTPEHRAEAAETSDSIKVVYLADIKERREKSFDEVRSEVEKIYRAQNVSVYLNAAAEQALADWQNASQSLEVYANANKLPLRKTEKLMSLSDATAELSRPLLERVLSLYPGDKQLIQIDQEPYLVEITEVKDEYVPELKEVHARVVEDYRRFKAGDLARAFAENAIGRTNTEPSLSLNDLGKPRGLSPQETKEMTKESADAPFFGNATDTAIAFSLERTGQIASKVLGQGSTLYVIALAEVKSGDISKFESEKHTVELKESKDAGNRLIQALVENQRRHAELWIDPELEKNTAL